VIVTPHTPNSTAHDATNDALVEQRRVVRNTTRVRLLNVAQISELFHPNRSDLFDEILLTLRNEAQIRCRRMVMTHSYLQQL